MTKKKFFQILLFFLFIFTSLILFKKFNKYITFSNYTKIIILVILASSFLIGSLNDRFIKPVILFLTYFVFVLYAVNFLIVVFNYNSTPQKKIEKVLKKDKKPIDKRKLIDVVKDERNKGKEIYPYVVPREFLKNKNSEDIILTPMPNTEYVSCNEFGKWKKIKTDKLGFNNNKFLESFDILLLGDSFAEGSCVDKQNEPASLFKKNFNKDAYNIGISGNGPLLSLALAHEIKPFISFDHLVWLIFDNDFYDLSLEVNSPILKNYLKQLISSKSEVINSLSGGYKYSYTKKSIKKLKGYRDIRIFGMGGSSLGAMAIYDFLRHKINKNFYFLTNLNQKIKFPKKKYLNLVISKSGNTLETIVNSNLYIKKMIKMF